MEELDLTALQNEHLKLKEKVANLRGELENAETALENARGAAEEARTTYVTAKNAYESAKAIYDTFTLGNNKEDGSTLYSQEVIGNMEKQLEEYRKQMEKAEREKTAKEKAESEAVNKISGIQKDAQDADERMNLILASFGANEKINSALVNELNNTYYDQIQKHEKKIKELEASKTPISDDKELKELLFGDKENGIDGLENALEEYNQAIAVGDFSDIQKKLNKVVELHKKINKRFKDCCREQKIRRSDLTQDDINKMLTEKDDQGRMVISAVDRLIDAEKIEIASIENERDSIIEVMGLTLEMSKDPVNGTPELQGLLKELEEIESIVKGAEKDFQDSNDELTRLGNEKADLTAQIEKLKATNPNYAEIIALEAELEATGSTGSLPNPEYTRIKGEIERIKQELANDTEIDNPDYAVQKAKVAAAEKALKDEEGNMNPEKEEPDDIIEGNGMHLMCEAGLEQAIDNYNASRDANPDLAELYDNIQTAMDNIKDSEGALKECTKAENEAFNKLTSKYVSNTVYPDLKKTDSSTNKALEAYRAAELAVREAMLAYQNEPTEANKAKLEASMEEYNKLAQAFKEALQASVGGKGELPSTEAVHNYLLHVLNKEKPTDKAYNIKNAENRITLLEKEYRDTDKSGLVADLSKTSKNLDKMLPMLLSGEIKIGGDAFKLAMKEHEDAIGKFGADKSVIVDRLKGTGPVVDPKKLRWWQKLFNWMPKEKVEYDFKKIVKPEEYRVWEEAKDETLNAKECLKNDQAELKGLTEGLDEDQKGYLNNLANLDSNVRRAEEELAKTPEKVNKSKIARLKAALDKEKDILRITPAKKSSKDKGSLEARLAELEEKIKTVPEVTEDSKEVEAKKARLTKLKESNPNIDDIANAEKRINEILGKEDTEKQKNVKASEILDAKRPRLTKITSRISLLEKIRSRFKGVTEYIRIKDAGKMSDNRKRIARTLAEDTKSRAREDAER